MILDGAKYAAWSATPLVAFATLLTFLPAQARAQDSRHVVEPTTPPVCVTLKATHASVDGHFSDADEQRLDTAAIQRALDACPAGQAVELARDGANNAFLAGPLRLKSHQSLQIARDVTLYASRNPRDYDTAPNACGVISPSGKGCQPLIALDRAESATILGPGAIDGRGWAKMLGSRESWWELAERARKGGSQNCPRLVVADRSRDFTLYNIVLRNSPNFHVVVSRTQGFTAWGVILDTPARGARNTDGIDPSSSSDVSILYSWIRTGDDNVAIKAGGNGAVRNVTIAHNHFYAGHGMSIGSETNGGVSHVLVDDLTIDGADNGLRIKSNTSKGGVVEDITYRNVCMRNVRQPIFIDPLYFGDEQKGDKSPTFRNIVFRGVRSLTPGFVRLMGIDAAHRSELTLDGVALNTGAGAKLQAAHVALNIGPAGVNIAPQGDDVTLVGHAEKNATQPPACAADRWPNFPVTLASPRTQNSQEATHVIR